MENVPIDIHYNKLLDWLVDRRHCNLKWQKSAGSVKERINVALCDMPANTEINQLLSGTDMNFFHCRKMLELLKNSGEGSKNIFGQYSSQRMKDWAEILQLYQEDNIHLAEAAHLLMRNVNYEIPSLKRQIGKCQQTQRDCTRKETEYKSNAGVFKEKYFYECKQMGVKGENVKRELIKLVDELPTLFEKVAEKAKNLQEALNYYSSFVEFVLSKSDSIAKLRSEEDKTEDCPLINFICKHGNATVYQWRTGKEPKRIRRDSAVNQNNEENGMAGNFEEIDWGIVSLNDGIDFGNESNEIDFGDEEDEIDFGDEDAANVDLSDIQEIDFGISVEENGAEIDFGIEAVGDSVERAEAEEEQDEIVNDEDVATGNDALSVLENANTRNLFIDELVEVQSFLLQRYEELSSDGDILSAKQFQSAPVEIQMQSKGSIRKMRSNVSSVIDTLLSNKMQNLYRLKSSPRYVDRLADSLQQKLKTANNLLRQARAMTERRKAARELQIETEPKLAVLIKKTKELKQQIAEEISKKYKNRPVNIMGEVNSI